MAGSDNLQVPRVHLANEHCLILSFFNFGPKAPDWHEEFGIRLAHMHLKISAPKFGFACDNYLGTSLQANPLTESWLDFWRTARLEPQIQTLSSIVGRSDALVCALTKLDVRLEVFLAPWAEQPVFIHGDLWAGNASATENGLPIIFDPAAYFASREAEFGMMRLFGGFRPTDRGCLRRNLAFRAGLCGSGRNLSLIPSPESFNYLRTFLLFRSADAY